MLFKSLSIEWIAKYLDAIFFFPRPANEQYLSSYRAMIRFARDVGRGFSIIIAAIISLFCIWLAWFYLDVNYESPFSIVALILALAVFAFSGGDIEQIQRPYRHYTRRESFGSAHWADAKYLKNAGLVVHRNENPIPEAVPLALYRWRWVLALPLEVLARHIAFFGPPGSGKTASFFMNLIRSFSDVGGSLVLDTKGEIYRHTAHYYRNVYRFDLTNPEWSDWFDVLSPCKNNSTLAGQVASYMIGFDPNSQASGNEAFWNLSATEMLKCLILHLCQVYENPMPHHIFQFLTENPTEQQIVLGGKIVTISPLADVMEKSPDSDASFGWGAAFRNTDPKTLSGVKLTMLARIACFRDPKVQQALSKPSKSEAERGRRRIDFKDLRKKGTAVYVVVPEGEASRLETVIATFFAMGIDVLRATGDDPNRCYTMVALDEAGNVPLRNLSEGVGVGRGRGIIFVLGWQNISQPSKQYGRETALSIIQSIGTKVALPGIVGETAAFFVSILNKTTIMQRSTTDAVSDAYDHERISESGRDLMNPDELRQMLQYKQALVVIESVPPIRATFPPNAKEVDPKICVPRPFTDEHEANKTPVAFQPKDKLMGAKSNELISEEVQPTSPAQLLPKEEVNVLDTQQEVELVSSNNESSLVEETLVKTNATRELQAALGGEEKEHLISRDLTEVAEKHDPFDGGAFDISALAVARGEDELLSNAEAFEHSEDEVLALPE